MKLQPYFFLMRSWDGRGRWGELALSKSQRAGSRLTQPWPHEAGACPSCHPAAPSAGFTIHSARLCIALAACVSSAFTIYSSRLFNMVSWGKQSQKPYISLKKKKNWHEMWTGIWEVKILLFLHERWYLERLEAMFRFYLFLVTRIACGFFWECLSANWWYWTRRKCAGFQDFIHKALLVILINHILSWNYHNLAAEISSYVTNLHFMRARVRLKTAFPRTGFPAHILVLTSKALYLSFCPHAHKECHEHYYKLKGKKKDTVINEAD